MKRKKKKSKLEVDGISRRIKGGLERESAME